MRGVLNRFSPALAVRDALTGCDELAFFQPVGGTPTDVDDDVDIAANSGTAVRVRRLFDAAKIVQAWKDCAASVQP
jgi:hypothetical protein